MGFFQNPAHDCIAGDVTLVSGGGAIVSSGAATVSNGSRNAAFLKEILDIILHTDQFTMGEGQWLGLVNHGDMSNDRPYIVFGDGSLHLALPDSRVSVTEPELFTSQLCQVQGTLQDPGLVMLTAWESARPDSYYTLNNSYLIEHLSTPGVFYRGLAPASPEFTGEMFVPEVAATGDHARIRYFAPGSGGGSLSAPIPLTSSTAPVLRVTPPAR